MSVKKLTKIRTQKKFDELDIVRVFLIIGKEGIINRTRLAIIGEIGEGSVRSIIEFLVNKDLVMKKKRGNVLSAEGYGLFKKIEETMTLPREINSDVFKDGLKAYGSVLKDYEKEKIRSLYKARDHAIRTGCNSAMVLICTYKHIKIPYVRKWNFDELRNEFDVNKGNLIILTSAEMRRVSEKGIIAIARYLSDKLNNLFSEIVAYP